jgi:hypothetical protein
MKKSGSTLSKAHKIVYDRANLGSFALLSRYGRHLPPFVTANLVTSVRLSWVLPTTILLSNGYTWLPASLVMANAVFDYVDGAVARWERGDLARAKQLADSRPALPQGVEFSSKTTALDVNWGAFYGRFPMILNCEVLVCYSPTLETS